ncbi:MAG: hypothetical protein SH847_26315 [Roseiflexaceae bacterium]|nr:hypothetical protein [Roseiflexaceae bacterium]
MLLPVLTREQIQAVIPLAFRPLLELYVPHSMMIVPLHLQGVALACWC